MIVDLVLLVVSIGVAVPAAVWSLEVIAGLGPSGRLAARASSPESPPGVPMSAVPSPVVPPPAVPSPALPMSAAPSPVVPSPAVPSSALPMSAAPISAAPIAAAPPSSATCRLAVLVPAHDEAAGIAPVLQRIVAQLEAGDRCLVVADNCSDRTAGVARAAGAEVVERSDATRRGKGYALDFGVRHLAGDPPDAVVVVDADCAVAAGALRRLATVSLANARPTQALYAMQPAAADSPLGTRLAAFAWLVKNDVRAHGAARLGWPVPLMGTGMAFPWPLLRAAPLATGHLVEDMQLGLDLASRGAPPLFCPSATVWSTFPTHEAGLASQRMRWEHGHLSVIAGRVPGLVARALRRGDAQLFAMALDLLVPPLASLVLSMLLVAGIDLVAALLGASAWPLAVVGAALALVGALVVAAWWRRARALVAARELVALPWYVLRKLPMYARLAGRRQVEWVRTRRHG